MSELIESWRKTWRVAAPLISDAALAGLEDALVTDSPRLLQGATTEPPPLPSVADWPCEAACLLGYCGVIDHGGFGVATVEDVQDAFGYLCFETDNRLGEPSGIRWCLNHYDETKREEMIAAYLPEVRREIERRRNESVTV